MHTENLQKSVCMQPCVSQVWFYLEFPRVTCMCRFPSPMGSGSLVGFIWLKQNTLITRDLRVAHVHRTWGTYADVKSPYEMILSQRTLIQRCGNIPKSALKVLCVFFDCAKKKTVHTTYGCRKVCMWAAPKRSRNSKSKTTFSNVARVFSSAYLSYIRRLCPWVYVVFDKYGKDSSKGGYKSTS